MSIPNLNPVSFYHSMHGGLILVTGSDHTNTISIKKILQQHRTKQPVLISFGSPPVVTNCQYIFAQAANSQVAIKMAYQLIDFAAILIFEWLHVSMISMDAELYLLLRRLRGLARRSQIWVVIFIETTCCPSIATLTLRMDLVIQLTTNNLLARYDTVPDQ